MRKEINHKPYAQTLVVFIALAISGMVIYTDFLLSLQVWPTILFLVISFFYAMFFRSHPFFLHDNPTLNTHNTSFTQYSDLQIIFIEASEKVLIECSESLVERYGLKEHVMVVSKKSFLSFVHPDDKPLVLIDISDYSFKINPHKEVQFRIKLPGASHYILMFRKGYFELDNGLGYIAFDITHEQQTQKSLSQKSHELNALTQEHEIVFDSVYDVIIKMDVEANIIYASKKALEFFEKSNAHLTKLNMLDLHKNQGLKDHTWYEHILNGQANSVQTKMNVNGSEKHIKWHYQPVLNRDKQLQYIIAIGHENTDLMTMQDRLNYEKNYDALTGLLNRTGLYEALKTQNAITHATAYVINIKSFSQVNHYYGQTTGDELLVSLSRKLKQYVDKQCLVSRYASGEFVIVSINEHAQSTQKQMFEKIIHSQIIMDDVLPQSKIQVKKYVGCANYPDDVEDLMQLITYASIAMQHAYDKNIMRIVPYAKSMHSRLNNNILIASKLKEAIAQDAIDIHFQKIINIETNEVLYLEGLSRWYDSELGNVPPLTFIKSAQEAHLTTYLETYLVQKTIKTFANIKATKAYKDAKLTLNLTPESIYNQRFIDKLIAYTTNNGLKSHQIVIEVSEKTFVDDIKHALKHLQHLKSLGFEIALDDFGKEYSSLAVLEQGSFDIIKIDAVFTKHIESIKNQEIIKMVKKITTLSNKRLIIEGVETKAQKDTLEKLGCLYQQGYYIHSPQKLD